MNAQATQQTTQLDAAANANRLVDIIFTGYGSWRNQRTTPGLKLRLPLHDAEKAVSTSLAIFDDPAELKHRRRVVMNTSLGTTTTTFIAGRSYDIPAEEAESFVIGDIASYSFEHDRAAFWQRRHEEQRKREAIAADERALRDLAAKALEAEAEAELRAEAETDWKARVEARARLKAASAN